MNSSQRELSYWAAGVLTVSSLMLLYAIYGDPPYAYFGLLKFWIAGSGVLGSYALYRASKWNAVLVVPMIMLSWVELTAKMHREDWVLWNWLTIAVFGIGTVVCLNLARKRKDG